MEKHLKFISPDIQHRYVRKLANEALDIEFDSNYNNIQNSNKTFIIWNPYGYLAYNKENYINKYEYYQNLKKNNKDAYVVERGALPNSIFIDKNGFLFDSCSYDEEYWNYELTKEQIEQTEQYINEIKNDITSLEPQNSARTLKEEFFKKLNINNNQFKKIVFVPMQCHNDTVMYLWADWIQNQNNFIDLVKKLATNHSEILFLIKNHPVEKNIDYHVKTETNNFRLVDDFHYKDCITYSDLVLTINSGIGLQAMMWDKPTCVIGKAFYQFNNINFKAHSVQDIINWLYQPKYYFNREKMLRFIYYLRFVFYSFCTMKKTGHNASEPVLFEKITYENDKKQRINYKKEIKQEPVITVLFDFINNLSKYSLMKLTCLDCINYLELKTDKNNLFIATNLNEEIIKTFKNKGYQYENFKFFKDGITVHIEQMPRSTKIMTIYGTPVSVPMPVVGYLRNIYGNSWKNFKKDSITVQTNINSSLNIAYSFNLHGWVFEFESLYYKKHSKLNVIPILEKDLKGATEINIAMIPSAWHYRDLTRNGTINKLKRQNVKTVVQYNSHITTEIEHKCEETDLIMASSEKLKNEVQARYNYDNLIFMPHFVDTEFFSPKYQYNNFTLGWTGNFKNTYKNPELIEKIKYSVLLQADYKKSLKEHNKQEKMPDFYNSIDVLLITSKSEGTPLPLLEAMACGKVVLSTDVGIASMVLNPFFIVEGKDSAETIKNFNQKLDFLKEHPEILKNEGERNLQLVRKYFDWKKCVHILDKIYKLLQDNNIEQIKYIAEEYTNNIKLGIENAKDWNINNNLS